MLAATARALVLRRSPTAVICSSPLLLRSLSSSSSPLSATSSPSSSDSSSSSSSGSSSCSGNGNGNGDTEVLLLRDYVSRKLTGYFSAPVSSSPVGELARALEEKARERSDRGEEPAPPPASIDFPSLSGRSSYEHALSRLYRALSVSWLTPSELFSPHYGRAVARFVAEDAKARAKAKPPSLLKKGDAGPKIRVVEVGAGRGTLAADFLGYLSEVEPALHRRTRYVSLEVSPSLARAQEEKVLQQQRSRGSGGGSGSGGRGQGGESPRFSSVVGDASDVGAWRRAAAEAFGGGRGGGGEEEEDRHLYVLAFEVLDNLPHDRVVLERSSSEEEEEEEEGEARARERRGRRGASPSWLQTFVEVEASTGRPLKELLGPASDRLISLCLAASPRWQDRGGGRDGSSGDGSVVARFFDSLFSFVGGGAGGPGGGRSSSSSSSSGGGSAYEESGGSPPSSSEIVFLPTGAASMFSSLFEVAPDHTLLAADFDALPGVAVAGANAPLVASTRGGVARDYASLYSPPVGEAVDIFFPTNFEALSDLYVECARRRRRRRSRRRKHEGSGEAGSEEEEEGGGGGEEEEKGPAAARHCKQSSFLSLAVDTAAFSRGAVSTASGWSPMLDDWNNTAVLVARSKQKEEG